MSTTYLFNLARTLTCGAALLFVLGIQAFGQAPAPKPQSKAEVKKEAKGEAKGARQADKQAREAAKNRAKDSREAAKDEIKVDKQADKQARDAAKDHARDARDAAKDDIKGAKGAGKEARDAAIDRAKEFRDGSRDRREEGDRRDLGRDDRDVRDRNDRRDERGARDRDDRDSDRAGARSRSRTNFRASDVRSADIGLWFDTSSRDQLILSDVSTTGAIARLGFHEGDRIVSVDGRRVRREADFVRYLFADDVRDDRVKVIVIRNDEEVVIWVEPAVLIEEYVYVDEDPMEQFGIVLDDRYDDRIVVWKVIARSPAYYAGIRAGDVIVSFQNQRLSTRDEFVLMVRDLGPGEVSVQVRRNNRVRDLRVDMPQF